MIILESRFFSKEYRVPNIGNITAVLSAAIKNFNELHKLEIERLQDEEIVNKSTQRTQSNSKESKGQQTKGNPKQEEGR